MKCPECGGSMKRDVPLGKFLGDVAGVVVRAGGSGVVSGGDVSENSVAGKTASSIKDYWTNEKYYKCKECGHCLYD